MPQRTIRPMIRFAALLTLLVLTLGTSLASLAQAQNEAKDRPQGRLNAAFARAAAEFDVPRDLLVAVAFAETRFNDHNGQPSIDNGYGLMHLVENPRVHTLSKAAAILGLAESKLQTSSVENIRGGAAILRDYADQLGLDAAQRQDLEQWYVAVARYSNSKNPVIARFYADEVYNLLSRGISGRARDGELISAWAQSLSPQRGPYEEVTTLSSADYPSAHWVPADSSNYSNSNRPSSYPINYVIIHVTQGSYAGTISWFQNPDANVSAHYVIRSSDGDMTQMVHEEDIAWHAGNWDYNTWSIGIEHEGFVDDPAWFTDAMYKSSAALTRYICNKYGIPKDRQHIIGHNEVPGATHTDPGPHWDWNYYMQLVKGTSWSSTVDNATSGRFSASSNWGTSSWSNQRYGADYRYTTPETAFSDAAWYKFDIPQTGSYEVYVWYPANSGYNSATPYIVKTPNGNEVIYVDQRVNGGQWNSIGTFSLAAGDYNAVGVSRWTSSSGYIIADAVRLVQR